MDPEERFVQQQREAEEQLESWWPRADELRRKREEWLAQWRRKHERPLTDTERRKWDDTAPLYAVMYLRAKPAALDRGRLDAETAKGIETMLAGVPATYLEFFSLAHRIMELHELHLADQRLAQLAL